MKLCGQFTGDGEELVLTVWGRAVLTVWGRAGADGMGKSWC